jgi:pilus assembly protein CpaB
MIKKVQVNRSWMLMSVSVVFGLLSVWAIDRHLQVKTEEIESKARVPKVLRIVAARNLTRGALLNMDDLASHAFPKDWITSDAIPVDQADILLGKQLNVELKAGQLLHLANISEKSMAALASRLEAGKRAITIPVDQINSLSGLLSPSDVIDLYVSFEHLGKRVTSPLLTGVEVIATGRDLSASEEGVGARPGPYATVTLVTTPEEAVKLVAARQTGSLTAVLSQVSERDRVSQHALPQAGHLAGLLGLEKPPAQVIPIIYGDRFAGEEALIPMPWTDSAVDQFKGLP